MISFSDAELEIDCILLHGPGEKKIHAAVKHKNIKQLPMIMDANLFPAESFDDFMIFSFLLSIENIVLTFQLKKAHIFQTFHPGKKFLQN